MRLCFHLRVVWPCGTDWSFGLLVGCSSCQLLYQREMVDQLVDRMVDWLVNRMVIRLDAVAHSYYTTRKRLTGWPKLSTGWDKRSTSLVSSVLRDLFRGWFKAQFAQLFKVDFMA